MTFLGDESTLSYRVFSHDVAAAILLSQNNENDGHVSAPNQSSGSCTLFLCKLNAFFCSNKFA